MKKEQFAAVVSEVEKTGLSFKAYPETYLINVTDISGIVQSYYASTGTAIFRDSNNKYHSQKHTERGMQLNKFLELCNSEDDIMDFFD